MATNRELVDSAWAEVLTSTISGSEWQKRVDHGYKGKPYNWPNTAYGRAKALLDQVKDEAVTPPPPPPPPPPPSGFGALLPARLAESTGTVTNCVTRAQVDAALASVPDGSTINITANIDGGGSAWNLTRSGTASAPITISCNPGVLITNCGQVTMSGNYTRLRGWDYSAGGLIKMDRSHQEIDQCRIHDNYDFGVLWGSEGGANVPRWRQIWNSYIYRNGNTLNQDHNVYAAWTGSAPGSCIVNCVLWDPWAYNLQAYAHATDLIISCCTIDGGQSHANSRGGLTIGADSNAVEEKTTRVIVVGCIFTNAPTSRGINIGQGADAPAYGNNAYDCIAYGNAAGDYQTDSRITYARCISADPLYTNRGSRDYTLQAGSPAIDYIDPARYGYVPTTDILGNTRVTADAGAFAA